MHLAGLPVCISPEIIASKFEGVSELSQVLFVDVSQTHGQIAGYSHFNFRFVDAAPSTGKLARHFVQHRFIHSDTLRERRTAGCYRCLTSTLVRPNRVI
jgi:hypothetical protein